MTKFTDIFIRRPVLATVVSLLIFIVGLRAVTDLAVRQYPKMDNTVITVTTTYAGAPAGLIEGFITAPIEKEVASADGIDYMVSTSTDGTSTIQVYVKLNYNPNDAFTSVMSKVAEVSNDLPKEAEDPVIDKETGSTLALMYLGLNSDKMTSEQITDYISRVVQPKLETVQGVAQAEILGGSTFAMRIWLDPDRMAALGVTAAEVTEALTENNFQSAAGKTKGEYVAISIDAKTDTESVESFKNIVIKDGNDGALVRLRDVARVELGAENYDSSVYFNGKKAVFIGITATPTANPLSVITKVKKILPNIKRVFPPSLHMKVVYDATEYIQASIDEVIKTIAEATVIVILIIFLFLGSFRTVLIPIVTIPLSLVGVCVFMLWMNYSINLLTLLAMVLAIGMVVDDAIVVVENIYRHIEEGQSPFEAAIQGAREIAMPVISMTITLAAVYAPIGFMGGLTGALFKEFAFTLAATVVISGIIALTLSPMMCSKVLTADISQQRLVKFIDAVFLKLKNAYGRLLGGTLAVKPVMVFFAFVVLLSCMFLFLNTPSELAPEEDQGVVFVMGTGPESATLDFMERYTREFNGIYQALPATEDYFTVNGNGTVNSMFSAVILKPWNQRSMTQTEANQVLNKKFQKIAGLQIQAFARPPLPTGGSPIPIQFVLTSTSSFAQLYPLAEKLMREAQNSGLFITIFSSLKFNKPQLKISINRSKAGQLGINMRDIAMALAQATGGNYVNRFNMSSRSYEVIPQVERIYRLNPEQLKQVYVKTASGKLVSLATIVDYQFINEPNSLTHFQQLNSVTLSGILTPGNTISDGLRYLRAEAEKILPNDVSYNYAGRSRQFMQEGNALLYTFCFSVIIIFLVLAAQFESFRDPLVIMISVPMAIAGALLPLNWGLATVNIYTEIGLITLIGLISKHGILMVEFANKLREHEGLDRVAAIQKAAMIRLRPVLMTTASMILGVMPLLLATGAGAHSRFDIGLVISSGMLIGTLFTLFVVPTMYSLKAKTILLFLLAVSVVGFLAYDLLYVVF